MHTWYKAICDECKEMCDVLVTSTFHVVTDKYLEENEKLIMAFLSKHYGHSLKLSHDNGDGILDKAFEEGYLQVENLSEDAKKKYCGEY